MRTPSSRRRPVIAAAIIIFVAIVGWLIFSSLPSDEPTISFAGTEPHHGNAVGFWVTNTIRLSVHLESLYVQSVAKGDWKTEFENRPPVLGDPDMPRSHYSPLTLASGESRKILVTPSTNTIWRAGLVYSVEVSGFGAWIARIRLALRMRDIAGLHATFLSTSRTNFSAPITNALPKS